MSSIRIKLIEVTAHAPNFERFYAPVWADTQSNFDKRNPSAVVTVNTAWAALLGDVSDWVIAE